MEGYSEDEARAIAEEAAAENRQPELTSAGVPDAGPGLPRPRPGRLVALWQEVEDTILRDVARRIGKMDALTPTANWQLWRYQQTEAVRKDVVKLLARYTGKSEAEIPPP